MISTSKEYNLSFLRKIQLTPDIYSFYFDRKDTNLNFLPGQYARLTLPHENPDNRGTSRFFTISSSPTEQEYLVLTPRILHSSFKRALDTLKPGEKVKIFAPLGKFILDENDKTPRVFLAGGIGITTYHSMIAYASAQKLSIPITLFVSFSTTQEMVFFDELTTIAKQHPNIRIIYTITKPEQSQGKWQGETGRISTSLLKKYVTDLTNQKFYIVGASQMVESMYKMLKEINIPEEKIITENFPGY